MGLIYLDACLVMYLAEGHPAWSRRVRAAMQHPGTTRFVISPLVKMECPVGVIRRADPLLRSAYQGVFATFELLAMPEPVYPQAAELRARFGLKTPHALHVACASHHRCDALWTNDGRLARASHGLARRIPR